MVRVQGKRSSPPGRPGIVVVVAVCLLVVLSWITNRSTKSAYLLQQQQQHTSSSSFSACLLVMDDNHRLVEWLAYHYYALPLRYLVVAVDPNSKTSPSSILARWKTRMTIVEWTEDADYVDLQAYNLTITSQDTPDSKTSKHRLRQGLFYHACTKHLHKAGRTYTAYLDVDEYLTVNANVYKAPSTMTGSVLRAIHELQHGHNAKWRQQLQRTCFVVFRSLISAKEEERMPPSLLHAFHPAWLDPKRLDTLRYRYRAASTRTVNRAIDGFGKSILDVSRVVSQDYEQGWNAHKPLVSLCPTEWLAYDALPLGIYHYLGNWRQYSYRQDARKSTHRSFERWKARSELDGGGETHEMQAWVKGFVELVGDKVAQVLLEGAGLDEEDEEESDNRDEWKSILEPGEWELVDNNNKKKKNK